MSAPLFPWKSELLLGRLKLAARNHVNPEGREAKLRKTVIKISYSVEMEDS